MSARKTLWRGWLQGAREQGVLVLAAPSEAEAAVREQLQLTPRRIVHLERVQCQLCSEIDYWSAAVAQYFDEEHPAGICLCAEHLRLRALTPGQRQAQLENRVLRIERLLTGGATPDPDGPLN